jgi:putative component of toxin-antitoxin plasmid stabilization module
MTTVLLCVGDKNTQAKDSKAATRVVAQWNQ